jgi:hypothetical protein
LGLAKKFHLSGYFTYAVFTYAVFDHVQKKHRAKVRGMNIFSTYPVLTISCLSNVRLGELIVHFLCSETC